MQPDWRLMKILCYLKLVASPGLLPTCLIYLSYLIARGTA